MAPVPLWGGPMHKRSWKVHRQVAHLSPLELATFKYRMAQEERLLSVALFLTAVTGIFGGQHYYLKQTKVGVAMTLLFWTGIPMLISIFELAIMHSMVASANDRIAAELVEEVKYTLG